MIEVPRGAWFAYKYSLGAWDGVEKGPACAEVPDRTAFGAADTALEDTVAAWRPDCE
jgi:hypothetical protein